MNHEETSTHEEAYEGLNVDTMKLDELRKELKRRKIKSSGNKADLVCRLKAALILDDEHEDNDEDTDDDHEDQEESDLEIQVRRATHLLTFRDVEEAMQPFRGDDTTNIEEWLREFEEMAELCQWTEVQKLIYVKRLLQGPAKLFLRHEKAAKTWTKVKKTLKEEFGRKVDSHRIHRELSMRKKSPNETYEEYIYKMYDIATQANVDVTSTIKYIVDGIQDAEINKAILYGAKNLRELKEKFVLYDTLKANMRGKARQPEEQRKERRATVDTNKTRTRCFNCGDPNHVGEVCPMKNKGRKCFECNKYGHIASECVERKKVNQILTNNDYDKQHGKYQRLVTIKDHKVNAFFDSGSDLTLMRASCYRTMNLPTLKGVIHFNGVGSKDNRTLGGFRTDITVDECTHEVHIHVVPDTAIGYDLVIGHDFLDQVCTVMVGGKISVTPIEKNKVVNAELLNVLQINVNEENHELDSLHIADPGYSEQLQNINKDYEPSKTEDIALDTSFVAKDDAPVYRTPSSKRKNKNLKRNPDVRLEELFDSEDVHTHKKSKSVLEAKKLKKAKEEIMENTLKKEDVKLNNEKEILKRDNFTEIVENDLRSRERKKKKRRRRRTRGTTDNIYFGGLPETLGGRGLRVRRERRIRGRMLKSGRPNVVSEGKRAFRHIAQSLRVVKTLKHKFAITRNAVSLRKVVNM